MEMAAYQEQARKTAIYEGAKEFLGLAYVAMGLAGEAGEVAGKVKKVWRDDKGVLSPEKRDKLIDEGGDVMWYLSLLADELGISLGEMAQRNLDKLFSRKERGVLTGSGDVR